MLEVIPRPRAEADLLEIWLYIAADNLSAANRLIDRIDDIFGMLARQPDVGTLRPELGDDFRSYPVSSYVIYYRRRAQTLDIARVLHSARDLKLEMFTEED